MKVVLRTRINGRLPDPQGKYRDEITQEATVELDIKDYYSNILEFTDQDLQHVVAEAEKEMGAIRAHFYAELKRLGGKDYEEEVPTDS